MTNLGSVGDDRLLERMSAGRMGAVDRAVQGKIERIVTIKALSQLSAGSYLAERSS